jgi:uncharacterized protein (DUF433 family)
MAEMQTPPAEEQLAALEARVARIEAILRPIAGLPDPSRLVAGPPGVVTIIHSGVSPVDLAQVEKALGNLLPQQPQAEKESRVEPWKHLVARPHRWRRQLCIKGRNMTVRQLVGGIKANQFSAEQAAANYDLPVEAIREALTYAEENAALLDLEAAYERFLLAQGGKRRGPQPVSG